MELLKGKIPYTVPAATLLFPCGVGRVSSRLLSKLVGFYHTVNYVEGL
jgi:hypothetical protein